MFTVVVSPERMEQMRGVIIQDAERRIVAVMNTREHGWEYAARIALTFTEAESNKAKLDEALETIKALRLELAERNVRELVNEALYPAKAQS